MKKLLFGFVAVIAFGFNVSAQKFTSEEVRVELAKGMVSFVEGVKPAYIKGQTYETFEKTIIGKWQNTENGTALLKKAYTYINSSVSSDAIIKTDSGIEIGNALSFVYTLQQKNPKADGVELFGGTTGDYNPYSSLKMASCKWYQLLCHLNNLLNFIEDHQQTICGILYAFNVQCPKQP